MPGILCDLYVHRRLKKHNDPRDTFLVLQTEADMSIRKECTLLQFVLYHYKDFQQFVLSIFITHNPSSAWLVIVSDISTIGPNAVGFMPHICLYAGAIDL